LLTLVEGFQLGLEVSHLLPFKTEVSLGSVVILLQRQVFHFEVLLRRV